MNTKTRNYTIVLVLIVLFIIGSAIGIARSEEPIFKKVCKDDEQIIFTIQPNKPAQIYLKIKQGDTILIYDVTLKNHEYSN